MKLRPVQVNALNSIVQELIKNKKALAYLCVGFGKTVIMAEMCRLAKGTILITVPRVSLIMQTVEKLKWITDDIGVYCGSLNRKELNNQFVVSTLQSIVGAEAEFKTIIIDECHLMENSVLKLIKKIKHTNVLGLTGTPFLHGNIYGENKYWDKPCITVTIKELTKLKYLSPLKLGSASNSQKVDLTGVKVQTGDYVASQLFEKYKHLIVSQVKEVLSKTEDRKAVLWVCSSIDHAEAMYAFLPQNNAEIAHSKRKNTEGKIKDFREGKFKHLVSVSQISTGFDAPVADTLALFRPTKSPALFVQTIGRILRINDDKKDALLLDYGNVIENLGHPYAITSMESKKHELKVCPFCDTYNEKQNLKCIECDKPFLVLCDGCLEVKPYGEPCKTCQKRKIEKDSLKNLSEKAYDPNDKLTPIDKLTMSWYRAKSGNDCIKADYFYGFRHIVTEYFSTKFKSKEFKSFMRLHGKCFDDKITHREFYDKYKGKLVPPRKILLGKNGKYKNIKVRHI